MRHSDDPRTNFLLAVDKEVGEASQEKFPMSMIVPWPACGSIRDQSNGAIDFADKFRVKLPADRAIPVTDLFILASSGRVEDNFSASHVTDG
jgi:hypothetical protein